MGEDEYRTYRDAAVRGYAEDKQRSGDWVSRDALTLSAQAFHRFAPAGCRRRISTSSGSTTPRPAPRSVGSGTRYGTTGCTGRPSSATSVQDHGLHHGERP